MSEPTGGLSKAAKKNKKKNAKKKAAASAGGAASTSKQQRKTPEDLVPILKEQLEKAKANKDAALASKLREQIWVLNDVIAGVKTDMPESELLPIMTQLEELLGDTQKKAAPEQSISTQPQTRGGPTTDAERRIRNLQKRLDQINILKDRQKKGEKLEANQIEKLKTEDKVLEEIDELEKLMGEAFSLGRT